MTAYDFWYWAMVQLDLYGNVYIQKIRNAFGDVVELNPINAAYVQVTLGTDGQPLYTLEIPDASGRSVTVTTLTASQIIHIKGYSHNSIYGLSVIKTFKTLFDQYSELESAGAAIAKNAARPSGIISYPAGKEEEISKVKATWDKGLTGTNSGRTAWLPSTLTHKAFEAGLSAQEAEYISQRQFSAQRIAADIFRVPLHMLGLTGGPTYASVEQQALEWIKYTINPLLTNIEQQLNKQLLDDTDDVYTKFAVRQLERGDTAARIEWYKFAIEHGVMTPNQVHRAEDDGEAISSIDGGDTYVRPVNYQAVTANSGSVSA